MFFLKMRKKGAFSFLTSLLLCFFASSYASAKSKLPKDSPLPGEVISDSGNQQIFFEKGRILQWPNQGPLLLKGETGQVLASIDLRGKIQKESGAQALGLEVEEVDLGGSMGSKKYLSGKKDPHGRSLGSSALAGKASAEASGKTQSSVVEGIQISSTTYPNGAFLLKFKWPDFTEEIYFDRRKTLVSDQQTRQIGSLLYSLKQFGDGSFSRSYLNVSGGLTYTYDANDKSFRFSFTNANKETVKELNCQEECS